ncbi:predicted protein [Chaetomium globosum CBS 148.51]|uniref:Uncharacterized protein n=1 Tax=Chaetomium globosum (strain ATCC 6205 / CBS 148.51 / DSM 1962 / NBRC 6347 / NRRL 1970) TaxID=306901 RepID=Q2GNK3_CHAGB|nr:uncharacterized protein CHGG_10451 [Chaetomium globosum CBS 148.51]EAQ84047.1 predicted protein [Chaetomium globosum CBS 148.51]
MCYKAALLVAPVGSRHGPLEEHAVCEWREKHGDMQQQMAGTG